MRPKDTSQGNDLKNLEEYIKRCMRCGFCRAVCPVFEEIGIESLVTRGKLAILEGIIEGKLEPTEGAARRIFQCTICKNCYEECPAGVEVDRIISEARVFLSKKFPSPAFDRITNNLIEKNNPYGEEMLKSIGDSSFAYFPGCTTNFRVPEIAKSARRILDRIGQEYRVLQDFCCGSILFRIGRKEERERLIEKNLESLQGVETLLLSCAGCYKTFKSDYHLEDEGIEVVHIVQYLYGLIEDGTIDLNAFDARITYHDPCHLGRHMNVYEEPRKILECIPKLELVEMERTKNNARCCGAGGGMSAGFKEIASKISMRRIEDAKATGAGILSTACPFCYLHLKQHAKELKVFDISYLVNKLWGS
jgi:Fe-S oxidoreductase